MFYSVGFLGLLPTPVLLGFPCGSVPSWQRRWPGFDPCVGKIPLRRERLPTPVFWSREFRRLYSPWDCKELDTTEWLSFQARETVSEVALKELAAPRRWGKESGYTEVLKQSFTKKKNKWKVFNFCNKSFAKVVDSLNFKRLLLIKENQISQGLPRWC